MYKIFFLLLTLISITSFGEVEVKLREPLKFKELRRGGLDLKGYAIAEGLIEITGSKEDIGKLITFKIPKFGYMTNKKRWLKIEKIIFEKNQEEVILTEEKHFLKIYGVLDKHELNKDSRAEFNEGKYIGYIPINYSIYSKEMWYYEKDL